MKKKIALTLALSALLLAGCNSETQIPQTEQNVTAAAETFAVTKNAETEQAAETSEALPLKVNISERNYNTDINIINLPSFT